MFASLAESSSARQVLQIRIDAIDPDPEQPRQTFEDLDDLTASIRADGSSKFGEANRWASFPSIAAAWRISQEGFMSGAGWLSDLKLRLSYGANGNQGFDSYQQYKT